jgi:hypothetical protein
MNETPPALLRKRKIKSVNPLQLGKMFAVLYGLMGLLLMPIFLVMTAFSSHLANSQRVGMLALGTGFAICAPFIYAVMGFIFGALGALLYNVAAKWLGGIEVEVE